MLRRERLYAIECEKHLRIHGVFNPQRTVVVEGVPRRERVGCVCNRADTHCEDRKNAIQKNSAVFASHGPGLYGFESAVIRVNQSAMNSGRSVAERPQGFYKEETTARARPGPPRFASSQHQG